jgi:hypothetical protein
VHAPSIDDRSAGRFTFPLAPEAFARFDHAMANSRAVTHPNQDAFPPGVSGPALRALHRHGVRSLADLVAHSRADLALLHGMGTKALTILADALNAKGLRFRGE